MATRNDMPPVDLPRIDLPPIDLLVIGAGPAGLAHAFWRTLDDPELDVRIVDKNPRPGGLVRTERIEGYVCEHGPQGIRPTDDSDAIFTALGIENDVVAADPSARLRYLGRNGTLHTFPSGPGDLIKTDIFDWRGKLSLCLEPLRRRGNHAEESLAGFVGRRFGKQAIPLAEAMASGVYGGDAHAIELQSAFPSVASMEQDHGSLIRGMMARRRRNKNAKKRPPLCTFRGGMETFAQALRRRLDGRFLLGRAVKNIRQHDGGWQVTLGGEVESQISARQLVLAIPARCTAALLDATAPDLASELRTIPYASVANIYLGFWSSDACDVLQGFGFLLDRQEQTDMLGAIYCSSVFPQSASTGKFLVRLMAGGTLHPETMDRDDEDLAADAEAMLRRYTGLSGQLLFRRVRRAVDAIPQYTKGHGARVERIRSLACELPGLSLIGNSYDDVSVVGQLGRPTSAASRGTL